MRREPLVVGVLKEDDPGEGRVALTPAVVPQLEAAGLRAVVEHGAGEAAGFPDAAYQSKGALSAGREQVYETADILVRVHALSRDPERRRQQLARLRPQRLLIGFFDALWRPDDMEELATTGVTSLAMDLMPRISRAQPMDALSAMATVAGYKAAVLAAHYSPKMFPLLMTAAGAVPAARVLVIGAGVAGLQAIATARRLGAVVQAFDVRPEVKEQVESLGARFLELPIQAGQDAHGYAREQDEEFQRREREMLARAVAGSDAVITTASVPGRRAPVLVSREMVARMQPGSVIVDLAADYGGNCELTRPGEIVQEYGVTILGPRNAPSLAPYDASQMYARNLTAFLRHLVRDGALRLDLEDSIVRETLLTHQGRVVHERLRRRPLVSAPA